MSDENRAQEKQTPEFSDGTVSRSRRETLGKLGRYALYTAPALLVLFESQKAVAAISN